MKRITILTLLLLCTSLLASCDSDSGSDDSIDGGGTDRGDDVPENSAPTASNISISADGSSPIVEAQLIGDDIDNDTLVYVLDSPRSGNGYTLAFVEADAGIVNVVLDEDASDTLTFSYRVTDGILYSDPASFTIDIVPLDSGGTGANAVAPSEYRALEIAYFDNSTDGSGDANLPSSIDLSNSFPPPGDQGLQGSCVGWAVAYALKSYQEKMEEQWEYSSRGTLFSPSWIYNQINGGFDVGSDPMEALQLIVDRGAATMATMPYDATNFTRQPGSAARNEAAIYRAEGFQRVNGVAEMRRALAARVPVTIGIKSYESLHRLSGPASVYSTFTGESDGGHMVTIVGYDDTRFGGAFKVINSWGTGWGDGGFFWIPYSDMADVSLVAFVLKDAVNSGSAPQPIQPPKDDTLPNLEVIDWSASYTPRAGGEGLLQWVVANTGASTAPAGADINLVLSRDKTIDPSDILVVYEELALDLAPATQGFRNETNPLPFTFPLDLPAGEYYMAVWVDDLDEVEESDERDNLSFSENAISFAGAQLPDLVIESWWGRWNSASGEGVLEYSVANTGNAALNSTDWDINLVLSTGTDVEETFAYYLFFEKADFALAPQQAIVRNEANRATFNMYESQLGNRVAPGDYYISLWVDDTQQIRESREYNNLSTDNALVTISSGARTLRQASVNHRYNGKQVPTDASLLGKITIAAGNNSGSQQTVSVELSARSKPEAINGVAFEKVIRAANPKIFPISESIAMPVARADNSGSFKPGISR